MANKRLYQLSDAVTTTGKYVMIDKSGNSEAERYSLSSIATIRAGRRSLTQGTTTINFGEAYETGSDYVLWAQALDGSGYDIGATYTNRTVSGFDVTVNDSCTLEFIAAKL